MTVGWVGLVVVIIKLRLGVYAVVKRLVISPMSFNDLDGVCYTLLLYGKVFFRQMGTIAQSLLD